MTVRSFTSSSNRTAYLPPVSVLSGENGPRVQNGEPAEEIHVGVALKVAAALEGPPTAGQQRTLPGRGHFLQYEDVGTRHSGDCQEIRRVGIVDINVGGDDADGRSRSRRRRRRQEKKGNGSQHERDCSSDLRRPSRQRQADHESTMPATRRWGRMNRRDPRATGIGKGPSNSATRQKTRVER
jgi:hypothetical protein